MYSETCLSAFAEFDRDAARFRVFVVLPVVCVNESAHSRDLNRKHSLSQPSGCSDPSTGLVKGSAPMSTLEVKAFCALLDHCKGVLVPSHRGARSPKKQEAPSTVLAAEVHWAL
jgi:hypothetical protein